MKNLPFCYIKALTASIIIIFIGGKNVRKNFLKKVLFYISFVLVTILLCFYILNNVWYNENKEYFQYVKTEEYMTNTEGERAVFSALGASSHSENTREENDFYATDPKALELLLEKESFSENIWECACGEGHTCFQATDDKAVCHVVTVADVSRFETVKTALMFFDSKKVCKDLTGVTVVCKTVYNGET